MSFCLGSIIHNSNIDTSNVCLCVTFYVANFEQFSANIYNLLFQFSDHYGHRLPPFYSEYNDFYEKNMFFFILAQKRGVLGVWSCLPPPPIFLAKFCAIFFRGYLPSPTDFDQDSEVGTGQIINNFWGKILHVN